MTRRLIALFVVALFLACASSIGPTTGDAQLEPAGKRSCILQETLDVAGTVDRTRTDTVAETLPMVPMEGSP